MILTSATPPLVTSKMIANSSSNSTMCDGEDIDYIPTVQQYREALGGYGTAFVVIGSVTTALLYLLFLKQMWFTFSNTHRVYRRHIYWLISIYPFVTLMSTLALVVPRSHQLCSAIKIVYMSIGVGHFADLTMLMYGSEEKMLHDLKDTPMKLDLTPLCCFLRFLPKPSISKSRMSLLTWMMWQMKWTQALYFILRYILIRAIPEEDIAYSRSTFVGLSVLNFGSFLGGVYALNIMSKLSNDKLQRFRYKAKGLAVKILILTVKLQAFIFDVLGNNNVFPCLGYMITPIVYQITLENSIFLVEMIIFGLFSYFMYRRPEFQEFQEPMLPSTQPKDLEEGAGPSAIQEVEVNKQPTSADCRPSVSGSVGGITGGEGLAFDQLTISRDVEGWSGLLD